MIVIDAYISFSIVIGMVFTARDAINTAKEAINDKSLDATFPVFLIAAFLTTLTYAVMWPYLLFKSLRKLL